MKLEKEDVYLILAAIISGMRMEVSDKSNMERQYAFIAGLTTMANEVIAAIQKRRVEYE